MMREFTQLSAGAAHRTAVAAACFLCLGLSQGLMAQEPQEEPTPAADEPEAAAAPAEADAPTPEATSEENPAEAGPAESAETAAAAQPEDALETIPVDGDEAAVPAGPPKYPYTFAATRLVHVEDDDSGTDGFGLEGSYLLLPNIFAVGSYFLGESDETSVETSQLEIGAGYRQELGPSMDLNASMRMVKRDLKSDVETTDRLGYRVEAGVRSVLLPRLETSAALSYVEISQNGHAFLMGSALYELLPRLSLGAEAIVGNSSTSYGVLGRWAF